MEAYYILFICSPWVEIWKGLLPCLPFHRYVTTWETTRRHIGDIPLRQVWRTYVRTLWPFKQDHAHYSVLSFCSKFFILFCSILNPRNFKKNETDIQEVESRLKQSPVSERWRHITWKLRHYFLKGHHLDRNLGFPKSCNNSNCT